MHWWPGFAFPWKRSLFQLILGINTAHITCDQEVPHMLFGLQSVQVAQAHPEKGMHYSEKLFLNLPWLASAWGWGSNSFTWVLGVLWGCYWNTYNLRYFSASGTSLFFKIYIFSISVMFPSLSFPVPCALHSPTPPFVHLGMLFDHVSSAEMKWGGVAGGTSMPHHCSILTRRKPTGRTGIKF